MTSKVWIERRRTAELRYYVTSIASVREKWKYLVCDRENPLGQKAIAKFQTEAMAVLFCSQIKDEYAAGVEIPLNTRIT